MKVYKDDLGKVSITIEKDYWNINKAYSKLTIVQRDGVFGTYISRKHVPAGTVLTDREYWIPFSSLKEDFIVEFNMFMSNYGKELTRQGEEIVKHEQKLNNHTQELEDIKNDVNDIDKTLNTLFSTDNVNTSINTYNEIIKFLENINDTETLAGIIEGLRNDFKAYITNIGIRYITANTIDAAMSLAASNAILDDVSTGLIIWDSNNKINGGTIFQSHYGKNYATQVAFYSGADSRKTQVRSFSKIDGSWICSNDWKNLILPVNLKYENGAIQFKDGITGVWETFVEVPTIEQYLEEHNIELNSDIHIGTSVNIGSNTKIGELVHVNDNANISQNVFIGTDAKIDNNVKIGTNTYICENVNIGTRVTIDQSTTIGFAAQLGNNANIERNVVIGNDTKIGSRVNIAPDVTIFGNIDSNTSINSNTHIGSAVNIQDNFNVGQYVSIGSNTTIDENVQIKNRVYIGTGRTDNYNVYIGTATDIANNVNIGTNTNIGSDVSIGVNSHIGEYTNINDNVLICRDVVVQPSVKLGSAVVIGTESTIYSNVNIGTETAIGNAVNIKDNVHIGDVVVIGNNASLGNNVDIKYDNGTDAPIRLHKATTVATNKDTIIGLGVNIGGNSSIGTNVNVDNGTNIGKNVNIGNSSTLYENISIGTGVAIGSNLSIGTNVNIKHSVDIENNVSIGSNTTIDAGITIGSNVSIGSSVIIPEGLDLSNYEQQVEVIKNELNTKTNKRELAEAVADLVNSTPEQLSTINILHDKLSEDDNIANVVTATIGESKKALFIDLWNNACGKYGKYNTETGYFELTGITDITYEEAINIYELGTPRSEDATKRFFRSIRNNVRVNLPFNTNIMLIKSEFVFQNDYIEIANTSFYWNISFESFYHFYRCRKLHTINGVLLLNASAILGDCPVLENITAKCVNSGIDITFNSNRITFDSVKYFVNNTSVSCTLKLHNDVYNALTGTAAYPFNGGTQEEWQQLLQDATEKNITLATV